jgi:hypothetical protein
VNPGNYCVKIILGVVLAQKSENHAIYVVGRVYKCMLVSLPFHPSVLHEPKPKLKAIIMYYSKCSIYKYGPDVVLYVLTVQVDENSPLTSVTEQQELVLNASLANSAILDDIEAQFADALLGLSRQTGEFYTNVFIKSIV